MNESDLNSKDNSKKNTKQKTKSKKSKHSKQQIVENKSKEQKTDEQKNNDNKSPSQEKNKEKKPRKRLWSAFEPLRKKASNFAHRSFAFGKPKNTVQRSADDSAAFGKSPSTPTPLMQTRPSRTISLAPAIEPSERRPTALEKTLSYQNLPSEKNPKQKNAEDERLEDMSQATGGPFSFSQRPLTTRKNVLAILKFNDEKNVAETLSVSRQMSSLSTGSFEVTCSEPLLAPFFGVPIESMHKLRDADVPTFVTLITSVLLTSGVTKARLFSRQHCDTAAIEQLQNELSNATQKDLAHRRELLLRQSPYTVAGLFTEFLKRLPSPLVPGDIFMQLVFSFELYAEYKNLGRSLVQSLIYSLPPPNRRLFLFVIAFLRQYIELYNKHKSHVAISTVRDNSPDVNIREQNEFHSQKDQSSVSEENADSSVPRRAPVVYTSSQLADEGAKMPSELLAETKRENNEKIQTSSCSLLTATTESHSRDVDFDKKQPNSLSLFNVSAERPMLASRRSFSTLTAQFKNIFKSETQTSSPSSSQTVSVRHPVVYSSTVSADESSMQSPESFTNAPQQNPSNIHNDVILSSPQTNKNETISRQTQPVGFNDQKTPLPFDVEDSEPLFQESNTSVDLKSNDAKSINDFSRGGHVDATSGQKPSDIVDNENHISKKSLQFSETTEENEEEKRLTQVDIKELCNTLAPALFKIVDSGDDTNDFVQGSLSELTKTISFLEQTSAPLLNPSNTSSFVDEQKRRELEEQRPAILEFFLTEPEILEEDEDIKYCGYDSNVRFVQEATPNRLIEKLLDETYLRSDSEYQKVFFLTYRYFISSRGLLQKLLDLYPRGPPETLKPWKVQFRVRILSAIQNWIETYYYELLDEKDFTETLYQFVKEVINNATTPEMEAMKYFRSMLFDCDPETLLPKNIYNFPTVSLDKMEANNLTAQFLQFDPKAFALTLTLWDHQLFCAIPIYEFIYYNSPVTSLNRGQINNLARRFVALLERTAKIREWVSKEIMKYADDLTKQANVVKHFIRIAQSCRMFNNFNGCYAIVHGLIHNNLNLSTALWERVGSQYIAALNTLRDIYSSENVWVSYRSIVSQTAVPLVPWLEIYPKLLSHLEEGAATIKSGEKLVNFTKLRTVHTLLKDIKKYQETLFTYQPDPNCAKFLVQLFNIPQNIQAQLPVSSMEATLYQPPSPSSFQLQTANVMSATYCAPLSVAPETDKMKVDSNNVSGKTAENSNAQPTSTENTNTPQSANQNTADKNTNVGVVVTTTTTTSNTSPENTNKTKEDTNQQKRHKHLTLFQFFKHRK